MTGGGRWCRKILPLESTGFWPSWCTKAWPSLKMVTSLTGISLRDWPAMCDFCDGAPWAIRARDRRAMMVFVVWLSIIVLSMGGCVIC